MYHTQQAQPHDTAVSNRAPTGLQQKTREVTQQKDTVASPLHTTTDTAYHSYIMVYADTAVMLPQHKHHRVDGTAATSPCGNGTNQDNSRWE